MLKKTRQTKQKEIIENIIFNKKGFFYAEEIYLEAKKQDSEIGIATIYRKLKELKKQNKIKYYICERKNIYSKEKISHCHFICEKTGKIIHFEIDNLNFLKNIKNKIPGEINSFQLEIRGICNKCEHKTK